MRQLQIAAVGLLVVCAGARVSAEELKSGLQPGEEAAYAWVEDLVFDNITNCLH